MIDPPLSIRRGPSELNERKQRPTVFTRPPDVYHEELHEPECSCACANMYNPAQVCTPFIHTTIFGLVVWLMIVWAENARDFVDATGPDVGIETIWLVPSVCSVKDDLYNRFVSYVDPNAYRDDDEAADQAVPSLGAACPAELTATPQEFQLPRTLSWAPTGHNESLILFRGEGDTVTLSYELLDANGKRLLSAKSVTVGPEPTPRGSQSAASPSAPAANAFAASRRQLFFWQEQHEEADDGDAMPLPLQLTPTGRRLLKGGGGYHGGRYGGGHSYGGRTYATASSPRVSHTSVTYVRTPASRSRYGYTTHRAVVAGTFVVLMHHPAGYGRYYDVPGCDEPRRGCELRVDEPLSREDFDGDNLTMSETLAFPLTLRINELEIVRKDEGLPSVYLTLYSPTGGVPRYTMTSQIYSWLWLPCVGFVCCAWQTLQMLAKDMEEQRTRDRNSVDRRAWEQLSS